MFYKNNFRPAFAAAGASSSPVQKAKYEGIQFDSANGDTDDFNKFDNTQYTNEPRKAPRNPKKKKSAFNPNSKQGKNLIIAIAAVVAFVLLIVIIFNIANASGKNLKVQNNSYVTYEQDGLYYVAQNGKVIGGGFENELQITPAIDNSFAYVIEKSPEGDNIYVLEKKELTQVVPNPVQEVVTLAPIKPGVVYKDNDAYYFYADESDERITKNPTAGNFKVAPDASALVYTLAEQDNVNEFKLYLYIDGNSQSYTSNMYPVEVSTEGKYIYAYGISSEDMVSRKLYVINTVEDGEKVSIETGFNSINYTNLDGDEIIYSTTSSEGVQSFVYNTKKGESHKIGAGICVPIISDKSVAALASLKDILVENKLKVEGSILSPTYYINNKYESAKISQYSGLLNSDGDMFYFVNNDDELNFIDLDDKNRTIQRIAEGVTDFVITEKDNVYFIDEENDLRFYKASTKKIRRIQTDVINMSMNEYSNILYFEVAEDTKAYFTEEGSKKEIAEFNRVEIQAAPKFVSNGQKNTFVYVENPDTSLYDLYYTSSGKSYKLIATGCDLVLDSIIPDIDSEAGQAE